LATPHERPLTTLDVIYTRRSVRSYAPQKLDESTIRALLNAAVQAPTAMHAEPWAFLVIQDAGTLKRCSDRAKANWRGQADTHRDLHAVGEIAARSHFAEQMANPDFSVFYNAGTLIVICGKATGPFVVADCWLAAENLMLAASAMGLGTCCIGSAVPALNALETKAELGVSADVTAIAPIVVGVPDGDAAPVPRRAPEILCWK
jgi:nitroreductase